MRLPHTVTSVSYTLKKLRNVEFASPKPRWYSVSSLRRLRATLLRISFASRALSRTGPIAVALAVLLWIAAPLISGNQQPAGSGPTIDFGRDVRPILAENCLGCHGAGLARGGWELTRRGA